MSTICFCLTFCMRNLPLTWTNSFMISCDCSSEEKVSPLVFSTPASAQHEAPTFVSVDRTWVPQLDLAALPALSEAAAASSVLPSLSRGDGISREGWHGVTKLCLGRSGGSLATVGKKNAPVCRDVVPKKSPWSLFLLFLPFYAGFARCKIQLSAVYREGECQFSC